MFDEPVGKLLKTSMEMPGLSARANERILKVARIIADLAEFENISSGTYFRSN